MDRMIKCKDCGEEFKFSEKDQAFYQEKGFQEPKRCRFCRQTRKEKHIKEV